MGKLINDFVTILPSGGGGETPAGATTAPPTAPPPGTAPSQPGSTAPGMLFNSKVVINVKPLFP